MKKKTLRPALAVSLVGIMAAMLECIKLALAFLPNIEAVTLFTALFGYCFGILGVIATVVFVMIEPIIYGFGSWVISYFLYWPLVALVFMLLRKARIGGRVIPTAVAVALTLWFGVLTSLVDVGLFMGAFDNFFYRFFVLYARGIVFYALQVGSNTVLFLLLFPFLSSLLLKVRFRLGLSEIGRASKRASDGEMSLPNGAKEPPTESLPQSDLN